MSDTVSVTLPWHASPEFLADICRRLVRHGFDFGVTHTDDTNTFHAPAEALAMNCLPASAGPPKGTGLPRGSRRGREASPGGERPVWAAKHIGDGWRWASVASPGPRPAKMRQGS